jgi:DNA-binding NtrC family response regulator
MRKTIRLISLEHDARDVTRINASLANDTLHFEPHGVDRLVGFPSHLMSESCDVIMSDLCPSDIDVAKVLSLSREIKPEIPVCMVADAFTDEQASEYLAADAAHCVVAPRMRPS